MKQYKQIDTIFLKYDIIEIKEKYKIMIESEENEC